MPELLGEASALGVNSKFVVPPVALDSAPRSRARRYTSRARARAPSRLCHDAPLRDTGVAFRLRRASSLPNGLELRATIRESSPLFTEREFLYLDK